MSANPIAGCLALPEIAVSIAREWENQRKRIATSFEAEKR
jgi:hypothetical protein